MANYTRRQFLKTTAITGALAATGGMGIFDPRRTYAYMQSPIGIHKFTMPLPGLGPNGIPVATAIPQNTWPGSDYYKIVAGQFKQVFHPDFYTIYGGGFAGTTLWGYASENPADLVGGLTNHRYLGGFVISSMGRPVRLQVKNGLIGPGNTPLTHPVAVDPTVMDPLVITPQQAALENRIAVHLHGGFVPWISDGGPFSWYDPFGVTGPSFFNIPDMPAPPPGSMTFYYPNNQSSRLMWYHDHAYGLTRLNAYVGLATGYLLMDQFATYLINSGYIPAMNRLVPLVVQEKTFIPLGGNTEPGGRGAPGDLWYPSNYEGPPLAGFGPDAPFPPIGTDTGRWDLGPGVPPIPPSAIPEFFGDTAVINGACYPFLEVEQRRYRFLILNASQARFFNLQLYYADPNNPTEIPVVPDKILNPLWMVPDLTKVKSGPKIIQIGTEGGFLPCPVKLNDPPVPFTAQLNDVGEVIPWTMNYNLLLGPAERADIVIDFSKVPKGSKLILYNDAPAPFPSGDPRNDYYTGAPDYTSVGGAPTPQQGFGPNTRTLMQFIVKARTGPADPPQMSLQEQIALNGLRGPVGRTIFMNILPRIPDLLVPTAPPRRLALYENFDSFGRLRQMLGTLAGPTGYTESPGEVVREGDIEVWEIFNTTGDIHPMHFHLVNVQILGRAPYVADVNGMPTFDAAGRPVLAAPYRRPDNNERGYKETVRMNPGEVIRVIMKFDLPATPFKVPVSPRLAQPPYSIKADEYVWHCHILEHEEHDMMHALSVVPKK